MAGLRGFFAGALQGILARPVGVAISGSSLYVTSYSGVAVVTSFP